MSPEEVRQIHRSSERIQGWFMLGAARVFAWVDEIQKTRDTAGNLFEIGCHHGKSAVLLNRLRRPDERLGICDLFGEQEANESASGSGDRQIAESNLRAFGGLEGVDIYQGLSSTLSCDAIGTDFRIFHVDGGHLAHEALADLHLAADCTVPEAVIVLDDAFSAVWPGVSEAIFSFLDQRPEWRAWLIAFNKLFLVRADALAIYHDELATPEKREAYGLYQPAVPRGGGRPAPRAVGIHGHVARGRSAALLQEERLASPSGLPSGRVAGSASG